MFPGNIGNKLNLFKLMTQFGNFSRIVKKYNNKRIFEILNFKIVYDSVIYSLVTRDFIFFTANVGE